ncbi:methionine gamma-lyase [Pseudalkalibacillus berkeleyi]|uniref:L-methionine gamma-lyase n=1 Tax=Pseudalkalibacillus berkeleyi TaxID=1069813 RepID=A0ABS9GZR7_9BACL|nr:methionine gamma-lyase [Pseudalkalibacillus berkeleyi]MCF6138242.1 methionine gamma-lyase [Pseudalkalibacillus berkeleyi]
MKKRIETEVIHSGYSSDQHHGALAPPIYPTSTFVFPNAETGEQRFAGEEEGYIYSRLGNPTVKMLEDRIAVLEGGEKGLAFGSGMAAVSAVLLGLTKSDDHILCSQGVYGCTFGLLQMMEEKYRIEHDLISMTDPEVIEAHIQPNTKVLFIETPINPTMTLVDLEMIGKIAEKHNVTVVVDNTFSTPYLQRPLEFGCHIVIHSATKYIGGHGDVVAGLVVSDAETIKFLASTTQKDIGGIMSPFDAWLLLRGLKTLPIRMDRHCDNASYIFEKLKAHPMVESIAYPGDPQFRDYMIANKQMDRPGGLISFTLKGDKKDAQNFLNTMKMIKIAVSLGDAETLIQHPATMTHAVVGEEARAKMGISDTLVRLSIGLEAKEDIWADIEQGLKAYKNSDMTETV